MNQTPKMHIAVKRKGGLIAACRATVPVSRLATSAKELSCCDCRHWSIVQGRRKRRGQRMLTGH
jgi:hypothetical protein